MRAWVIPACALIAVIAIPCELYPGDGDLDRSLRGIRSFNIIIDNIPSEASKDGLDLETLRTDVELRLRKAGIEVSQTSPVYLSVSIDAVRSTEMPLYAYSAVVAVLQPVTVESNGVHQTAVTWLMRSTGYSGSERMARNIRDSVGDVVDRLLNAYLRINPK